MEDWNSLTNEELRFRLLQFGFPNQPVTANTRKVLIRKLQKHVENEKSKLKRNTSYATRYSSDEDLSSDGEKTTNSASSKKRTNTYSRSTIASTAPNTRTAAAIRSNISMPPPASSSIVSVRRKCLFFLTIFFSFFFCFHSSCRRASEAKPMCMYRRSYNRKPMKNLTRIPHTLAATAIYPWAFRRPDNR